MDVLNLVRQKAARPLKQSRLLNGNPLQFSVTFDDDFTVVYKDSVGLRLWAVLVQRLSYERIQGPTDHCTESPVGYYHLLGFRSGDAVLFRDEAGVEESILFS